MKLYELQKGTKIKIHDNIQPDPEKRIVEFSHVDGMYCVWRNGNSTVIMGHANQDVSGYGEILDDNNNRGAEKM